ncbi:MAG: hypothetical protein Fur0032_20890 [Terrimicrobiaceae bacterium]
MTRLIKLRARREILLAKINLIDRQIAAIARREGLTISQLNQLLTHTHK